MMGKSYTENFGRYLHILRIIVLKTCKNGPHETFNTKYGPNRDADERRRCVKRPQKIIINVNKRVYY